MATKKKPVAKKPAPKPVKQVDESKPLEEAVTPKADTVHESMVACKECSHGGAAHYGSSARWCNVSGCQCQAYK